MGRYFLDTHILIWLLTNEKRLDNELRYDIQYPSGNLYVTSEYVILELMHLKQLGKINFLGNASDLFCSLESMNIGLELITPAVFNILEKLPILTINGNRHTDMMDRVIIAHCIAYRCTLISHDAKFPYYRKYGLKLLEA